MKFRETPKFDGIRFEDEEQCEPGYWLGRTEILGVPFHVEVIEFVHAEAYAG